MLRVMVLAIFVAAGFLPLAAVADGKTREQLVLVTASGRHTISAEIAVTPEQQARGLMFRRSMAADEGMLFVHEKPREQTMWMRNTLISLDMVFILADGKIHRIEADTEPFSERIIASNGPVAAVLELNAGVAAELGLRPGDTVEHPRFRPVAKQ